MNIEKSLLALLMNEDDYYSHFQKYRNVFLDEECRNLYEIILEIKSNNKLSRISWTQNGEDITIYSSNDEIVLYRKFNSYTPDNIDLYFETDIDSYNISFQISNTYKFEIKLMLLFDEKNFNLYIDDEFIK